EGARRDELLDPRMGVGRIEAEIVAQVAGRRDAERARRDEKEAADGLGLGRRRRRRHRGGQDALREVVDALEVAPRRRRHDAGPEEIFERALALAPPPPGALPAAALAELAGAQGAARLDLAPDGGDEIGPLAREAGEAAIDALAAL